MKSLLFYIIILSVFSLGTYFVLSSGSRLETVAPSSGPLDKPSGISQRDILKDVQGFVGDALSEKLREPLSMLLLQIVVILLTCRLFRYVLCKAGQPPVIGEMIAGIVLGPSFMGIVCPKALAFLFPTPSMGALRLFSQIGVIVFMFLVGMEINAGQLREKVRSAVLISHASILAPFFMGVTVSLLIYPSFARSSTPFASFALFMGVAMSITAFPVLARIIKERGMSDSPLGSIAIACAAVDDVTAWCVLAAVIALVKLNGVEASLLTIFLALTFTVFMLYILRPKLDRMVGKVIEVEKHNNSLLVGALALAFISAYFTDIIGVHALFGSFLAGVVTPANTAVRSFLRERLASFSHAALLPLFFAFTGLRTQISLLNDWQSWLACMGIIIIAIIGKLGGSMLAARWTGMSWPDSMSIGALMNTRGLMELVALNIGYDLGILPGRIFAIMVLMALVTTCMTGPLLSLAEFMAKKYPITLHAGLISQSNRYSSPSQTGN